ncbi:DUF3325 domain-containing protein [Termitidicoccus mucosus]|uniref:DUF3325 domain-containing protein n=1 Tax=Termitidicoccus mucosus TaxID=1184151 RepID=A0A178IBS7_9BACT|nr:hypothetical protein AW736_23220 [Opitutaceae bacterium TSB47]
MLTLVFLSLAFAATNALALAMAAHHHAAFPRFPRANPRIARRRLVLRIAGWLFLALAVLSATLAHGLALGLVWALAALSSAGLATTLLLTYAPRTVPFFLCAAPPVAAVGWVFAANAL